MIITIYMRPQKKGEFMKRRSKFFETVNFKRGVFNHLRVESVYFFLYILFYIKKLSLTILIMVDRNVLPSLVDARRKDKVKRFRSHYEEQLLSMRRRSLSRICPTVWIVDGKVRRRRKTPLMYSIWDLRNSVI